MQRAVLADVLADTAGSATPVRAADRSRRMRRGVAIMVAVALEAIIIAALVAASLGLGFEDVGTGPDRPPVPMAT